MKTKNLRYITIQNIQVDCTSTTPRGTNTPTQQEEGEEKLYLRWKDGEREYLEGVVREGVVLRERSGR